MGNNNVVPERSTLVITFVGPEGLEKWIGLWKTWKETYPKHKAKHVETMADYKKRLKPLNEKENIEKEKRELADLQRKYMPQSTPPTAENH